MTIENILIYFLSKACCIQGKKLRIYSRRPRWIFLLQKLDSTHIPFFKNLFLKLTASNCRNFLSEIITNKLEKLLMKIYRFRWDCSLQILSHCLNILKSNSLPKGSPVSFSLLCTNVYTYSLLSLWVLSLLHFSACFLNFGQPFTPKQWISSFLPKVLLQMRHLFSSSILVNSKKKKTP